MPILHIFILALVQGITEFLPVSSSGHLVLVHEFFGKNIDDLCWQQNRMLDVAVHVGTLLSVLIYFRRDLFFMASGILNADSQGKNLFYCLITASLPVIAMGFFMQMWKPSFLCLLEVMAWMTLIFGLILWVSDYFFPAHKNLSQLTIKDSLWIGIAQSIALVPGTSRSGVTMAAARILGFSRVEAAHFSLLLAIIAISGAGFLGTVDLLQEGNFYFGFDILIAIFLAFISGYIAITVMMRWLEKITFLPFVIYRIVLGSLLLSFIYF